MDENPERRYQPAMRVVSIGECMIELSGRSGTGWRQGFAGDTLNTLWYLRALLPDDAAADYVTAFGDDPFSAEQIAFLAENRIGIAQSPTIAGKAPGLYAIALDDQGERSFTYWRSEAAARHLADDADALNQSLAGADLVYFSGITLAILDAESRQRLIAALNAARDTGATVAFDPNYRPRLWPDRSEARAAIETGYRASTIVLPTFDDEAMLFGDALPDVTAERISAHGPATIIVKCGSAPALVRHGGTSEMIAPQAGIVPVDTTGAGDSFNGGWLAARLAGRDPADATRFAHLVAGRVIGHHGALLPVSDLADLRLVTTASG
ncbi:MAG: sugar kinase [Phyllobacteriaceae bacterium]|jgi:2-dehydro-3-deoxygluconokinase|nr:sugar kinase [Phyllobacteriaceae bacterium]